MALCQKKPQIILTEAQKARLEKVTRPHSAERRSVERAKIILACAEAKQNREIAVDYHMSLPRVSQWRSRFAKAGMRGLEEARRSGKPETYGEAFSTTLWSKLEAKPPAGLARWDSQTLAEALNASQQALWRVLKKDGIHLHRARSWCISTEPELTENSAHIIALYLNPPLNARVLRVDEKSSIQALERKTG